MIKLDTCDVWEKTRSEIDRFMIYEYCEPRTNRIQGLMNFEQNIWAKAKQGTMRKIWEQVTCQARGQVLWRMKSCDQVRFL